MLIKFYALRKTRDFLFIPHAICMESSDLRHSISGRTWGIFAYSPPEKKHLSIV